MKILSSFILIVLLSVVTLYSQIPRTISFQGVLADAQGNLVPDGNHQLQIVLYDQATNGNQVFIENQTVPVVKGIFNVIIGSVAVIPQSLSFDRAYFLGVSVDGGSELTLRTALTSVPYALRAERANIAEALSPNAAVVTRMNNQSGNVTLLGAGGTTVTNNGNAFTISSTGTGGTGIQGVQSTDGTIAIQNPNGPVATIGLNDGAITGSKLAAGQVVKSINNLKDDVTLTAGSNVTITPNGNALTIAATGGGSSGVSSINNANGALTLAASGGATVSTNGKIITINAGSGSGGTGIQGIQNTDNTLDITNPGGPTATINVKNQGITTTKLADGSVTNEKIPAGQVVKSVNTLKDDVTLAGGNNVTITPSGNTLTIAASGGGTSPWATNGNNISNTNSGNVGIGTSNPTAKLDIANGYLRAQDGANTPPTSGQGVELVSVASSHIGYLVSYDRGASHHRELDVDGSPLVLNVSSGGNVGIGTSTPTAKLEVNNATSTAILAESGFNAVIATSTGSFYSAIHGINLNGGAGVSCSGKFFQGSGIFEAHPTSTTWTTSKPATVKLNNGAKVKLFTEESTEIYFTDYGEGQLTNGKQHIELDPTFLQTVTIDKTHPLKVFVQLEDECNGVFVTNKTATGFDIVELHSGTSNAHVSYRIVCKRKYYEDERLATEEEDIRYNTNVLNTVWPEVIAKGKAEREKMEKMMSEHTVK